MNKALTNSNDDKNKKKISLFKSYKDNKKVIFNDKNTLNFISSIYNEITPIYLKRDYSRNS